MADYLHCCAGILLVIIIAIGSWKFWEYFYKYLDEKENKKR